MTRLKQICSYFCLLLFLTVTGNNAFITGFGPIKINGKNNRQVVSQTGKHGSGQESLLLEEFNEESDDYLTHEFFIAPSHKDFSFFTRATDVNLLAFARKHARVLFSEPLFIVYRVIRL